MNVVRMLHLVFFGCYVLLFNNAFAEYISVKKYPIYKYWLYGGAPLFDSPQEVVSALQVEQNRQSAPLVTSRLFNVRPLESYPHTVNGKKITWVWDYEIFYRDNTSQNYGGTTGAAELSPRCPGDDGGDATWARSSIQDSSNPNNIIFWCEKQFEIRPVTPFTDSCNRCPCPSVPARDEIFSDGGAIGKPIIPITGEEFQVEDDYDDFSPQGLSFKRIYVSSLVKFLPLQNYGLGTSWRHNYASRVLKIDDNIAYLDLPDGQRRSFVRDTFPSLGPWRPVGGHYGLTENLEGWVYEDIANEGTYFYNIRGFLAKSRNIHGQELNYIYNGDERLAMVVNAFGRKIVFDYDGAGSLLSVKTPDGGVIKYQGESRTRQLFIRMAAPVVITMNIRENPVC